MTSSMPSTIVLPLHESGTPAGPILIGITTLPPQWQPAQPVPLQNHMQLTASLGLSKLVVRFMSVLPLGTFDEWS